MNAELAHPIDFAGFRRLARAALLRDVPPDALHWSVAGEVAPQLFAAANGEWTGGAGESRASPSLKPRDDASASVAPAEALRVPAAFIELCRQVLLHQEPQRFARLYRMLWRLQHEPQLRADPLDAEWIALRHMAQAVRRDLHKMKAFVRFRSIQHGPGEATLHVAWFEPEHHIVEAVAPFFVRRFANIEWAILTPLRSVHWDGRQLGFGPAASRQQAPVADAGEALWLTYYRSIFNPARLKLRAMQKEMPRRYWPNLPEAALISTLSAQAVQRSGAMIQRPATRSRAAAQPRGEALASATQRIRAEHADLAGTASGADARKRLWLAQRDAAANCRECVLGGPATQTVWGEGSIGASLMLVGEQPGDQEDLQGLPFVGPSGKLLQRALLQLNWPRDRLYLTNSVKHFKYEPQGRRRMHKTPAQHEADACRHWLDSEIELVCPKAFVALGATAARQLLGRPVAVTLERGRWLGRDDGIPVLITLHPSALLRANPSEREADYAAWVADLERATHYAVVPCDAARGSPVSDSDLDAT